MNATRNPATLLVDGDRISAADLSRRVPCATPEGDAEDPTANAALPFEGSLNDRVDLFEARILSEVPTGHRWKKGRTAEELAVSTVGLRAKLEGYGLEPPVHSLHMAAGE